MHFSCSFSPKEAYASSNLDVFVDLVKEKHKDGQKGILVFYIENSSGLKNEDCSEDIWLIDEALCLLSLLLPSKIFYGSNSQALSGSYG